MKRSKGPTSLRHPFLIQTAVWLTILLSLAGAHAALAEGGPLYKDYCLSCHGETGLGNGNLAYALTPSPALLAYMVQQPIAVDHYLLWSIAEGGEQFGSSMPAFKDRLSREQIFQIIAYLRAGFPALDDGDMPAGPQSPGAVMIDEPNTNGQAAE